MILCYLFLRPKPGNSFTMHYTKGFDTVSLETALARLFTNLIMLLPNRIQFWNKHVFDSATTTWMPWAGVAVLVLSTLYFIKNNRLLLFYLVGVAAIFGFVYVTNMIQVRYSGHWFLLFVTAYALSLFYKDAAPVFKVSRSDTNLRTVFGVLFNVVLVTNALSGVMAYAKDFAYPFSDIDAAGKYLVESRLDRFPIVGATDFVISPMTYFIHKPIRLAESQRMGYFMRWDQNRRSEKLSFPDVIHEVSTVMNQGHDTVLVILDTPLRFVVNGQTVDFSEDDLPDTDIHLKFIHGVADSSIVDDEQFHFYEATHAASKNRLSSNSM